MILIAPSVRENHDPQMVEINVENTCFFKCETAKILDHILNINFSKLLALF